MMNKDDYNPAIYKPVFDDIPNYYKEELYDIIKSSNINNIEETVLKLKNLIRVIRIDDVLKNNDNE